LPDLGRFRLELLDEGDDEAAPVCVPIIVTRGHAPVFR
jgi:hypothetical protein